MPASSGYLSKAVSTKLQIGQQKLAEPAPDMADLLRRTRQLERWLGIAHFKTSIGSHTAKLAPIAIAPMTPQHHKSSSSFSMGTLC
jgi:hypothetical protein